MSFTELAARGGRTRRPADGLDRQFKQSNNQLGAIGTVRMHREYGA